MLALAASSLGTIPGWLTVIGILIGAWLIWRGGGGTALATLQTANGVLERRIQDLESQTRELTKENAELRGRTDVTVAIAPLITWSVQHEERAQERHTGTLKVLDLIASRLGPENGRAQA